MINTQPTRLMMRGVLLAAATAVVVPAQAKEAKFDLVSAVPDDVFICVAARHNPEREFLEDYWGEVMDALEQSGVVADVMGLMSGLQTQEQKAQIERMKEMVTKLLDGVDWKALGGGDFVFAERLRPPPPNAKEFVGVPDIVVMLRGAGDAAAKNYKGLLAILETFAEEVNMAAGQEVLVVEHSKHGKAEVASINLLRTVDTAPETPLAVSKHEEVILITFGREMLEDALGLLDKTGSKRSLATDARYRKALASLPTPENESVFFDVGALTGFFRGMMDFATEQSRVAKDSVHNAYENEEANRLADKGIEAYREKDFAKALEWTKKAHEVDKTDSRIMYNLACFHALEGHEDEALKWLRRAVDGGFHSPSKIAHDTDLASVQNEPRFKKALKTAEKHAGKGLDPEAKQWKAFAERMIALPGMIDYVATSVYTDGYSDHSEEITVLKAGADERAIYPVFANRQPVKNFHRYLPKETVSFSVGAGIDWTALYAFAHDLVKDLEIDGQNAWAMWEAMQQQSGVDVRRDVLGWIRGDYTTVSIRTAMGDQSVTLVGVKDEELARKQLDTALATAMKIMPELAKQNPAMAMMGVRSTPANREALPGFHNIYFGMMPQPIVCGVIDNNLVIATSADAVEMCLATARGEHPNVRENKTVMAEMIHTKHPAQLVSFTDQRNVGNEIAQMLGMVGMFGGMAGMAIPDPQAQKMLTSVLKIVAKLGPVAQKIDFFKSTSASVVFDGKMWRKRSVTNYRSPKERVTLRQ